ncbi:AfsR/SARP family transcriptional regulator [Streptomyces sp. SudanB66_2053]|uniref:AfsR/SARP family transcriptional regulator n=1 Tax=Streptomyces sp. SudanB66_2053 TaxID=3035277 RepID=UPI003F567955
MSDTCTLPLTFTLLGTPRVRRGEGEINIGSPQQQAVLAALVLRQGKSMTVEELVAAVWSNPPAGATSIVRTYMSRLRSALQPGGRPSRTSGLLRSAQSGYWMSREGTLCDVDLFDRDMHAAEERFSEGRFGVARDLLRRALEHWSGPPLAGLPGPLADSERSRLVELHLLCQERAVQAGMELGQHQKVVPELLRLTSEHPLREGLRQLLMLALYRCGRQAEALAVYHDARRVLMERLGIEPSPPLRALHGRILAADPGLLQGATALPLRASQVPAQLPAGLPDFTGRETEANTLWTALSAPGQLATPVAVITGMGGVGKSSLAVHVAHRLKGRYPDGQLYADLTAPDGSRVPPDLVLRHILAALGDPVSSCPEDCDRQAARFRSRVSGRRMLVLLDNAWDIGQVRALLPGSLQCTVIVTSRTPLGSLPTTVRVSLKPMDPSSAARLFSRIAGSAPSSLTSKDLETVAALCGGLPLALRIAAARHATRLHRSLGDTIEGLRHERTRLEELTLDDLSVRRSFDVGYRRLTAQQARAFRELALLDRQEITDSDAALVLGWEPEEVLHALESLVDANMMESPKPGHYAFHTLLRVFARYGVHGV